MNDIIAIIAIVIIALIAFPVSYKTLNLLKPDNRYSNGFFAMSIPLLMIVIVYCVGEIKTNYYLQKSSKITYGIITSIESGGGSRRLPFVTVNYIYNVDKRLESGAEIISISLLRNRRFHVNDTILVQYSETDDVCYNNVYKFNPTHKELQQYIQDKDFDLLKEYNKEHNKGRDSTSVLLFMLAVIFIISVIGIIYNRRLEKQNIQKYGDNSAEEKKRKEKKKAEEKEKEEKEKEEIIKRTTRKPEFHRKFDRRFFDR